MRGDHRADVALVLAALGEGPFSPASVPLRLAFVNDGPQAVRLLDRFEPVPVFFSWDVRDAAGTPLLLPGGGKVDPGPGGFGYRELGPGEHLALDVDLAGLVELPPRPDTWEVAASYHNQYGEDPVVRHLESNRVRVRVEPR